MTRRVIFPPADYWTQPQQENPMTNLNAGDYRRSCALVYHYSHRDAEGCNAVLTEAVDARRVTALIVTVCDVFQHIVPTLVTPLGMACMSELVIDIANTTDGDPDVRRAAQLIAHQANDNRAAINAVLIEADEDDRINELVNAILNLYETLLPALYSPTGLHALQRTIIDYAAQEDDGDDREAE
ncbi:hypothetical protein M4D79_12110 [Mycolicibacterium novocastrense]|nr:hypothetical protein M4D79_12110 [Mycolicibacterium novocastrense]